MPEDPSDILEEVIANEGDCEWTTPAICKRCPLGNKRVNGRRVGCVDYIESLHGELEEKSPEELNELFKRAAEEELFTLELEKLLE